MTADIELLPLPKPEPQVSVAGAHEAMLADALEDYFDTEAVQSYARANVAHHTAAKDAEIEALRAELDRLRGEHVRVRRDRNAAQARAERLAEALREVVELDEEDGDSLRNARAISRAALRDHDQEEK